MSQINSNSRATTFRYLHDERELSEKLGIEVGYPIRVFNLQGLGIDQARFLNDLAPTFHELAWDYYDVKRDQTLFLIDCHPDQKKRLEQFLAAYYANQTGLDAVKDLLEGLSDEKKESFEQIIPYRRRSICQFMLTYGLEERWSIDQMAIEDFSQVTDAKNDYRVYKRIFEPTSETVTNHVEFRKLLVCLAKVVQGIRDNAKKIKLICHQMSLVAKPRRLVTNAPEGIHQDGADYIVSAIVVERNGVVGGESRIYGSDKTTRYLTHTLQPGEGIFQADSSSPLWHDVTPISVETGIYGGKSERNIFGFDINIIE